ncbi:Amino acid permease [uncultured Desulfatiglans sp.]|nr:Amino acid permease [uncultured Desulfatiglans sp.]
MNDTTLKAPPKGKPETLESQGTLGTFAGVFTPSILTILGIILFLRMGFVVGSAGLGLALLILLLANTISVLTSISLSAIATNLRVRGGGDYYLISRTLGIEFGGAIGIVLFLAQSVSVAFYCIGFGEAVGALLPVRVPHLTQIVAASAVSFLFIFAWLGADWATRLQYGVMLILGLALVSFFAGGVLKWDATLLIQNWPTPQSSMPFWALFAIFFPAVTGFTQGVSMSGDLKDPGYSLPLGTFLAVGISIVVYFLSAVVFAAVLPGEVLSGDYGAMRRIAYFGPLIDVGVIAATLSSAMASFLGAPRILQSMASDRIFPFLNPFAKGAGPSNNPRRGVLLSAGIAYTTIALGQLNLIAAVVSMFFLISYGLLNYATYFEARSASPSFRPRFHYFNKWLSLAGALACLGTMLAVDFRSGLFALVILFAIFQYLKRMARPFRWADSRRSYHMQVVREHLLESIGLPEHPRYWRPQILAFSDNPERRSQLLRFSSWIEGTSGLTTVVRVLEGEGVQMLKRKEEAEAELQSHIREYGLDAFPLAMVAPTLQAGIQSVIQAYGIGPLKANTILLNWMGQTPGTLLGLDGLDFGINLRAARFFGCNLVILDAKADKWQALEEIPASELVIDVWWRNDATSRLMLLLSYLMTRHEKWAKARIRLLASASASQEDMTMEKLEEMLEDVRIDAEPQIIADVDADKVAEYSGDSSLVFLPFRIRRNQVLDVFGNPMGETLFFLPVTAMALAARDVELDAEPESGKAGEAARLLDALEDARKRAAEAAAEAQDAAEAFEKVQRKANQQRLESSADSEAMALLEKQGEEASLKADKTARRAAKAAAKAEIAAQEAKAAGVVPPKMDKEPE